MSVRSGSRRDGSWSAGLRSTLQNTQLAGRPLAWYLSGWRLGLFFFVVMVIFPWVVGTRLEVDAIAVGIYVILAVGLNIVVGYAGLLDLGYVAFFAIGSYAEATGTFGALQVNSVTGQTVSIPVISFWPLLVLGALIAGTFGILLGAPTLRLRGDYLAIVTLGFGEIVPVLFNYFPVWFGNTGMSASPPAPITLGDLQISFSDPLNRTPFYYVVLFVAVLVIIGSISLRDSSLGRAWVAIREDETAAASSGVNLVRTKLLAFGLGATMGGLGGVLNAAFVQAILPLDFSFYISISVLIMIVLGGIGSIGGVIVGAIVLRFIDVDLLNRINETVHGNPAVANPSSPLHFLAGLDFNTAKFLMYGLILLAMILLRPQGLIPDVRRRRELHGVGAAVEATSVIGVLEREETGVELAAVESDDMTTFAGPGADDIGRGDN
ncbi:MAG TPA: branched-chain amino acid ABC transporter permease [Ktedonobacterales bacterium]